MRHLNNNGTGSTEYCSTRDNIHTSLGNEKHLPTSYTINQNLSIIFFRNFQTFGKPTKCICFGQFKILPISYSFKSHVFHSYIV